MQQPQQKNIVFLFSLVNILFICGAVIAFMNLTYPLVGHDYSLAVPQMLDTALHFRSNGLSIQWYTPSFGSGLPAFPHPNNGQFSLLELPVIFIHPWDAVIFSSIVFISLGFFASYQFFYKVLQFNWTSSLLGAVFFSANGFMMERLAVGHLGYQPFPMLAVVLLLVFDRSISLKIASLLFGLSIALLIHQAGYFLIVIYGLSFLIIFPLIFLIKREALAWKRIAIVIGLGGLVAVLLSASKLAAVYSFMRYFPRTVMDEYSTNPFFGLLGILFQMLGTMNLVPISWLAGHNQNLLAGNMIGLSGAQYGYWEFDMSLSPIVFGILLAGINQIIYQRRFYKKTFITNQRWVGWLALLLAGWIVFEFILGRGLIYPVLQRLPIISSLHVNNRFAAALLFPLALAAAHIYNRWVSRWTSAKALNRLILLNILSLLPLITYFTFTEDILFRWYDIKQSYPIHQAILAGDTFEIGQIGFVENDTQALATRTSSLKPYDPIFGYKLENFQPEAQPGSIWKIDNGYYNMTNPAGYVFPQENKTRPFERIRIDEKDKLEEFVRRKQPAWQMPTYQKVANQISGFSFLLSLAYLAARASLSLLKKQSNQAK